MNKITHTHKQKKRGGRGGGGQLNTMLAILTYRLKWGRKRRERNYTQQTWCLTVHVQLPELPRHKPILPRSITAINKMRHQTFFEKPSTLQRNSNETFNTHFIRTKQSISPMTNRNKWHFFNNLRGTDKTMELGLLWTAMHCVAFLLIQNDPRCLYTCNASSAQENTARIYQQIILPTGLYDLRRFLVAIKAFVCGMTAGHCSA